MGPLLFKMATGRPLEFIREIADIMSEYKVSPCFINNRLHTNAFVQRNRDCCMVEEIGTAKLWHMFCQENMQFSKKSDPVCNIVENNRYVVYSYLNNHMKLLLTRMPVNCDPDSNKNLSIELGTVEFITSSGQTMRTFILSHLKYYKRFIAPLLEKSLNFCPFEYFDVFNDNANDNTSDTTSVFAVIPFRISTIITEPSVFFDRKRRVYMEFLRMYTKSDECVNMYANSVLKIKDRLHCSPIFFTRSRNVPPEFNCCYGKMENCRHILDANLPTSSHIMTNPHLYDYSLVGQQSPPVLCENVLKRLLDLFDESYVAERFGFQCLFRAADTLNEKETLSVGKLPPVLYAYNALYKRSTTIHRLCIPSSSITMETDEWIDSLFGYEKNSNH